MKLQKSNHTILLVKKEGNFLKYYLQLLQMTKTSTFTSVSGIGACDDVVLKFFNLTTKQYEEKHITEPLELTSLLGNISRLDNGHFAHLHATFGTQSYETFSGHLAKAIVSATAEIILTLTDLDIQRSFKDAVGLNLLDPQ